MKKQMNALKFTLLGAAVAAFGVGCASSGYARYDADHDDSAMGDSAQTEIGAAQSMDDAEANATVSALGRSVDTRADWVNRFPFYDQNLRTIETYTFVPDNNMRVAAQGNAPGFETSLPEGSVYVEAAGGASTGEVIRHTPNPTR
jgi:hypothetical protein